MKKVSILSIVSNLTGLLAGGNLLVMGILRENMFSAVFGAFTIGFMTFACIDLIVKIVRREDSQKS